MMASRGGSPAIGQLKAYLRDALRTIRRDRIVGLLAHLAKQLAIRNKSRNFAREVFAEAVVVLDDHRAAGALDGPRVVILLAIAMKRVRYENRRTRRQRDIGNRAAAAARDHEVGSRERARNVIDKWSYSC